MTGVPVNRGNMDAGTWQGGGHLNMETTICKARRGAWTSRSRTTDLTTRWFRTCSLRPRGRFLLFMPPSPWHLVPVARADGTAAWGFPGSTAAGTYLPPRNAYVFIFPSANNEHLPQGERTASPLSPAGSARATPFLFKPHKDKSV